MSNFAIETFTTKTNKVDLVDAAHVNTLQTSVVNIETALNLLVSTNGSFAQGTAFPVSPVTGQVFWRTDQNKLYVYNGSAWSQINISGGVATNMQIFTASGTWTNPGGVTLVNVELIGGGGGTDNANFSAGGGEYTRAPVVVSGNATVVVGAGGTGVGSGTGNTGGTTSFAGNTTPTALGGVGSSSSAAGTGGTGGVNTNGFSIPGADGIAGVNAAGGFAGILTGPSYGQGGKANQNDGKSGLVIVSWSV